MSFKHVSLCTLVLSLLGSGAAHAQTSTLPYGTPPVLQGPPPQPGQLLTPQAPPPGQGLSSWILYNQPCCCGPVVDRQPMRYELYLRTGPAIVTEGAVYGQALDTGWAIAGGARVLFFDLPQTKALAIDMGIINVHNGGRRPDVKVPIIRQDPNPNFIPQLPVGPNNQPTITVDDPVGIRGLNRTSVYLSGGGELYLVGNASGLGPAWRCGWDVGGRWGSAKAEFFEIRHRSDVIGSIFGTVHSDLEVPFGNAILSMGARAEWSYTWSDILQIQNNSDFQDLLLLGTIGLRW